jgi:hypothetical protein
MRAHGMLAAWAAVIGFVACSAGSNEGSSVANGAQSGSGGATGGTGAAGAGGGGAVGGVGGTVNVDAAGGSSGTAGVEDGGECTGIEETAVNKKQPSDIIIAIDQSGSMDLETGWVRTQINGFSNQIIASQIDVHVILIADLNGNENPICVDPPLGSGGCPTQDNNPPLFTHINQKVESHDAFQQILNTYDQYKDMLRPDSAKHIVVITDDESDMSAADFDTGLKGKDATLFASYFFHGIVSSEDDPGTFECLINNEPCCGVSAGEGAIYKQHIQATGGIFGDICLQDFQSVWTKLSQAVVQNSSLSCEWDIPPPPPPEQLDPNKVNVRYTGGGQQKTLGRVDSAADCANFKDAWYYDNNTNPTKVIACPDMCTEIQGGDAQKIEVIFGCATEDPIPR